MPAEDSLTTIRAAVDVIAPGNDSLPSASALGIERHISELAESYLEGFTDVIAALLDGYASELRGRSFVELSDEDRRSVLRKMSKEEITDLRDAADALFTFTYGGMYSEWTGFDPVRRTLRAPACWDQIGFHGPVLGHEEYQSRAASAGPEIRDLEP